MGLFDVFSFKKESSKVFNKEVFSEVLEEARELIIAFAKEKMPGEEKKKSVDSILTEKINFKITELNIKNKLVLWLVDQLIGLLPKVTQLIYEFLKEKVNNL